MKENDLPVQINANQTLLARYNKLRGVLNKQEAHINFQTLAAGWYEDESRITVVEIFIVDITSFQKQLSVEHLENKYMIADDVVMYSHNAQVNCFIAVTDSETQLLDKEPKLLSGYLAIKIKKVMNEVANQQGLLALPL